MDVKKVNDSVQLTDQLTQVGGQKPKGKTPGRTAEADTAAQGDTLAISDEAKEKANIARYIRIVKEMPDIREDRVADARRKLAAGVYASPEMADKIAERMIEE
jgi:negative regulator of flagellin synthesis FlgM